MLEYEQDVRNLGSEHVAGEWDAHGHSGSESGNGYVRYRMRTISLIFPNATLTKEGGKARPIKLEL